MIHSFEAQLETCLPDLWRFAWSLTHDRDAADDLVQDCVEKALRKRLLWVPGRPLKPWLTKMLLNIFRDQWRRRAQMPMVDIDAAAHIAALTGSAEDRLEVQAVWTQIAQLPQDQREALLTVAISGLSYAEAAKVLRIPTGTLMSRVARARAKIRHRTSAEQPPNIRSVK